MDKKRTATDASFEEDEEHAPKQARTEPERMVVATEFNTILSLDASEHTNMDFLEKYPKLQTLRIDSKSLMAELGCGTISEHCHGLRELTISDNTGKSKAEMETAWNGDLPNLYYLETLTLELNGRRVPIDFKDNLTENCCNLKKLIVRGQCPVSGWIPASINFLSCHPFHLADMRINDDHVEVFEPVMAPSLTVKQRTVGNPNFQCYKLLVTHPRCMPLMYGNPSQTTAGADPQYADLSLTTRERGDKFCQTLEVLGCDSQELAREDYGKLMEKVLAIGALHVMLRCGYDTSCLKNFLRHTIRMLARITHPVRIHLVPLRGFRVGVLGPDKDDCKALSLVQSFE